MSTAHPAAVGHAIEAMLDRWERACDGRAALPPDRWTRDDFVREVFAGWTVATTARTGRVETVVLRQGPLVAAVAIRWPLAEDDEDGGPVGVADALDEAVTCSVVGTRTLELVEMLADRLEGATEPRPETRASIEALLGAAPEDERATMRTLLALRDLLPLSTVRVS